MTNTHSYIPKSMKLGRKRFILDMVFSGSKSFMLGGVA